MNTEITEFSCFAIGKTFDIAPCFTKCENYENDYLIRAFKTIVECDDQNYTNSNYETEVFIYNNVVYFYIYAFCKGTSSFTTNQKNTKPLILDIGTKIKMQNILDCAKDRNIEKKLLTIFGDKILKFRDEFMNAVAEKMYFSYDHCVIPAPYFTKDVANFVIMEKYREYLFENKWVIKDRPFKWTYGIFPGSHFTEFQNLLDDNDLMRYMFVNKSPIGPDDFNVSFKKLNDEYLILSIKEKEFIAKIGPKPFGLNGKITIISTIKSNPFSIFTITDTEFYILTTIGFSCTKEKDRMSEIEKFVDIFSYKGHTSSLENYHSISVNGKYYVNGKFRDETECSVNIYRKLDPEDIEYLIMTGIGFICV